VNLDPQVQWLQSRVDEVLGLIRSEYDLLSNERANAAEEVAVG
jgi:hypothetical protein